MRWRKSLNTKCAFVNSPASLQSNHAHPNRCVSTASRPLLTTHAEHWKLNGSASASSVKPSVNARLGNAWRQSAVSGAIDCRLCPNYTACTVCSVAAAADLRSVAHLQERLVQVVELWNQFQTASTLKIRVSVVRFRPWPPSLHRVATHRQFRWVLTHTCTRCFSASAIQMFAACCPAARCRAQ